MKTLEDRVERLEADFMGKIAALTEEPYLLEALMRLVIRNLCHDFVNLGVLGSEVADHLDAIADVMRDNAPERE